MAAQHRRRRTVAGLVLLGILVLIIVLATSGGGGGTTHGVAAATPTYFSRIRTLAGTGSGSLAAGEKAAENAAITKTLGYTPGIRFAGTQHREIALTFDDGPGPYTVQLVNVLKRYHATGTFFEIGEEEQYFHAGTDAVVGAGFAIGDHTETHPNLAQLSAADQQSQLLTETSRIGDYGAPFPRVFRPPYGDWNSTTLRLLKKLNMLMVLWTVDTNDYELPGVDSIVASAVGGAKPGAIILMHDAGGNRSETIAALPEIITQLRAKGYKLVTIPKLILDNPPPKEQDLGSIQGSGG